MGLLATSRGAPGTLLAAPGSLLWPPGQLPRPPGIFLGTSWGIPGAWDRFWSSLDPFWKPFLLQVGSILGPFWPRFGFNFFNLSRVRLGRPLESVWDLFWNRFWTAGPFLLDRLTFAAFLSFFRRHCCRDHLFRRCCRCHRCHHCPGGSPPTPRRRKKIASGFVFLQGYELCTMA